MLALFQEFVYDSKQEQLQDAAMSARSAAVGVGEIEQQKSSSTISGSGTEPVCERHAKVQNMAMQ